MHALLLLFHLEGPGRGLTPPTPTPPDDDEPAPTEAPFAFSAKRRLHRVSFALDESGLNATIIKTWPWSVG